MYTIVKMILILQVNVDFVGLICTFFSIFVNTEVNVFSVLMQSWF